MFFFVFWSVDFGKHSNYGLQNQETVYPDDFFIELTDPISLTSWLVEQVSKKSIHCHNCYCYIFFGHRFEASSVRFFWILLYLFYNFQPNWSCIVLERFYAIFVKFWISTIVHTWFKDFVIFVFFFFAFLNHSQISRASFPSDLDRFLKFLNFCWIDL